MATSNRSVGGHVGVIVGGEPGGGPIRKIQGGAMEGDVVERPNQANVVTKQLANVRSDDWAMEIGLGMSDAVFNWLKAAIEKTSAPLSGTIVVGDANYRARRTVDFRDAVITEVLFPAMSAADKNVPYITVKFAPARVKYMSGDGSDMHNIVRPKMPNYRLSNFTIDIGGLPTRRVSDIGALAFGRSMTNPAIKFPKLAGPDLDVTLSEVDAPAWEDAARKWFIDGVRGPGDEMTATIECLADDMKTVVMRLTGNGVGFRKYTPPPLAQDGDVPGHANAVMYVQNWGFERLV